jgi:hypothetical protein
VSRSASSNDFSRARRLPSVCARSARKVINALTKEPPNCSWLTWAGSVAIVTGLTVALLGALQLILNHFYFTYAAPGFLLLSLFTLWIVTTVYMPPPRSTRNE